MNIWAFVSAILCVACLLLIARNRLLVLAIISVQAVNDTLLRELEMRDKAKPEEFAAAVGRVLARFD